MRKLKIVNLLVAIIFTASTLAWSMPDYYGSHLRPVPLSERPPLKVETIPGITTIWREGNTRLLIHEETGLAIASPEAKPFAGRDVAVVHADVQKRSAPGSDYNTILSGSGFRTLATESGELDDTGEKIGDGCKV